jgi:hypothetical protein
VSFPNYDALVVESQPAVPGGDVRLALLRRGAEIERDRIVALLECEVWDAPEVAEPYVRHIVELIDGDPK